MEQNTNQIAIGKNIVWNARRKMLDTGQESRFVPIVEKPLLFLTTGGRNFVLPIVGMRQTENCHYAIAKSVALNLSQDAAVKSAALGSAQGKLPTSLENDNHGCALFVESNTTADTIHALAHLNVLGLLEKKKWNSHRFIVCDVEKLLVREHDQENTVRRNVEICL